MSKKTRGFKQNAGEIAANVEAAEAAVAATETAMQNADTDAEIVATEDAHVEAIEQLNDAIDAQAEAMTLQEARNEETAIVVAEAAAKTKGKRGKRELDLNDPFMKQSIKLLRKENPKRKGSKSAARFNLYVDGMTVAQFIQAGGTRGDINWDTQHEHIELQPAPKAAAAE